ncbi:MAG: hypothetical protein EON59_04215 [Alphaproteobacteria bacterium]|nr:MAG: hypothetical protein EON59_04215 [Alphaproteobacteria bacterium]
MMRQDLHVSGAEWAKMRSCSAPARLDGTPGVANELKTYKDGYLAGWQQVTDLPLVHAPTSGYGYDRGLATGVRDAEAMLRKFYRIQALGG